MEKKLTAVEWLMSNLELIIPQSQFNDVVIQDLFKLAKRMEKVQIMEAVYDSMGTNFDPNMGRAEQYYNTKFKTN
jgi:hypothetical protein